MSILKFRNKDTNEWVEVPVLVGEQGPRGEQGPAGPAYVLTAEDKQEIVDDVLANFPTYNGEVESV